MSVLEKNVPILTSDLHHSSWLLCHVRRWCLNCNHGDWVGEFVLVGMCHRLVWPTATLLADATKISAHAETVNQSSQFITGIRFRVEVDCPKTKTDEKYKIKDPHCEIYSVSL